MATFRSVGPRRAWAMRFAFLGNSVPVAIATVTGLRSHHPAFYLGAACACLVPIIVTAASRRHRILFYGAAFGGIPALTAMQAYSGGVASGYSVLAMMAMVWFGLQATDRELIVGMLLLATCCYVPMLAFGPPAYPVSWGHATLLLLIGCTVAGSLRTLTRETQSLTRRLRDEAVIDDLTGLLNRRGWRHAAPLELARSVRNGLPVALVMLDLDSFKEINDRHGHDQGDRTLQQLAEGLRDSLRAGDIVARLGGDEFVALVSNCNAAGALAAVGRLRKGLPDELSLSAGIVAWDQREELAELLRRADLALYGAKAAGGNRTEVAPGPLPAAPLANAAAADPSSVAAVG